MLSGRIFVDTGQQNAPAEGPGRQCGESGESGESVEGGVSHTL